MAAILKDRNMNKRLLFTLLWDVPSWKDPLNALARKGFIDYMRSHHRIGENETKEKWEWYLEHECEVIKGDPNGS